MPRLPLLLSSFLRPASPGVSIAAPAAAGSATDDAPPEVLPGKPGDHGFEHGQDPAVFFDRTVESDVP